MSLKKKREGGGKVRKGEREGGKKGKKEGERKGKWREEGNIEGE